MAAVKTAGQLAAAAAVRPREIAASPADRIAAQKDLLRAQREVIDRDLEGLEQLERVQVLPDVEPLAPLRLVNLVQYGAQLLAIAALFVVWIAGAMMRDHLRHHHPESLAAAAAPEDPEPEPGS